MTVRFNLIGPPNELDELKQQIKAAIGGSRFDTFTDMLNADGSLACWRGDIERETTE